MLRKNMEKVSNLGKRLADAISNHDAHHPSLDAPNAQLMLKAANAFFAEMMSNPARLVEAQVGFWTESLNNYSQSHSVSPGTPSNPSSDKRFEHEQWNVNPIFNMIRRQYELNSQTLDQVTGGMTHLPREERDRVNFFTKQMSEMLAPTNFLATNPAAMEEAVATNGESLVRGLENLVADMERSNKGHAVTLADPEGFVLGTDMATTPGEVVFENRMLQLIQYIPTTEKVQKTPLLFCPPWVNKYYILDLRDHNSMVRWAVEQGHTVFMISWINPDESLSEAGFDTYLSDGLLPAIDSVIEITGQPEINTAAYCIGGTLMSCALGYLTAKGEDNKIRSATFFTTLTDFSEPGEIGTFLEEGFMNGIRDEIKRTGYLDGYFMSRTFSYLRSRDLVYGPAVKSYMMGQAPPAFDLLQWNSDNTNLPGRMAIEYLEKLYLANQLSAGVFKILGETIRLTDIKVPIFVVSTILDHIAPWKSTFTSLARTQGERTFILSESGHIAGIINPPSRNKYGYWHNSEPPYNADYWLQNADFTSESWWKLWNEWLIGSKVEQVKARKIVDAIEPAPGRYVLKKTARKSV
jgi:polyhydroxyalkanoate synthase